MNVDGCCFGYLHFSIFKKQVHSCDTIAGSIGSISIPLHRFTCSLGENVRTANICSIRRFPLLFLCVPFLSFFLSSFRSECVIEKFRKDGSGWIGGEGEKKRRRRRRCSGCVANQSGQRHPIFGFYPWARR